MQIRSSNEGQGVKLILEGRFDVDSRREFRAATEQALDSGSVSEININFDGVTYLDSSALGMLLLLREKAGNQNKRIVLSGVAGTVKQSLDIANFHKLFTIK